MRTRAGQWLFPSRVRRRPTFRPRMVAVPVSVDCPRQASRSALFSLRTAARRNVDVTVGRRPGYDPGPERDPAADRHIEDERDRDDEEAGGVRLHRKEG